MLLSDEPPKLLIRQGMDHRRCVRSENRPGGPASKAHIYSHLSLIPAELYPMDWLNSKICLRLAGQ